MPLCGSAAVPAPNRSAATNSTLVPAALPHPPAVPGQLEPHPQQLGHPQPLHAALPYAERRERPGIAGVRLYASCKCRQHGGERACCAAPSMLSSLGGNSPAMLCTSCIACTSHHSMASTPRPGHRASPHFVITTCPPGHDMPARCLVAAQVSMPGSLGNLPSVNLAVTIPDRCKSNCNSRNSTRFSISALTTSGVQIGSIGAAAAASASCALLRAMHMPCKFAPASVSCYLKAACFASEAHQPLHCLSIEHDRSAAPATR